MKDMTHEQLIRATYVVAKFKDPETAKLLNELAGRLDCALVAARTACLERDAAVRAEIEWEKAMMQAVGEDGVGDVVLAIEKLIAGRDALESAQIDHELTRGQLLIAHRTLLNQQAQIAALESRADAEPVAWRLLDSPESSVTVTDNEKMAAIWRKNGRAVQPLYPIHPCTDVPVGMVVSYGRQPSAHDTESQVFEVLVESGYVPAPGDKLYARPQPALLMPDAEAVYDRLSDHEKWSTSLENVKHVLNACCAAMLAAPPQQEVKP
ncbi:hypothetical protein [Atlantibacter hermannii]|uniref:hypothetical protein n=1 Tax=Atlantibacter hermannii TaxID=565 RepID=UPI0028AE7F57|nr:hypothetical protein [Atlantibacter hermannii]